MLNQHEQALLRGWIEGLGWPLLGKLYLGGAGLAEARAAVAVLRARLSERARQLGLEEQAAFWAKERAGAAWAARAEALLAELLARPDPAPGPDEPVGRWLPPQVARKLEAAGLASLGAVAARRRAGGRFWWRALPQFGEQSGRAVERLLQAHKDRLGPLEDALPARAGQRPEPSPLADWLAGHPELGGAEGANRAPRERCRLPAGDDLEAVRAWLALREGSPSTHRLYRKEAERFLLWAVSERGKPFSSLDTLDCKAYRDFLFAPPERWLAREFKRRWSPGWKPFTGPLTRRNVKLAETVLSSLCGWLVKQRYLDSNPFDGLPPLAARGPERMQVEHALSAGQWRFLLGHCAARQASPPPGREAREYRRVWIALQVAYCTGLRISELAAARFGDIAHKPRGGGQHWLAVVGKGGKPREVPLPPDLVLELQAYARERGAAFGVPGAPDPLVGRLRRTTEDGLAFAETPLSASALHRALRGFFKEAAAARRAAGGEGAEEDAAALERATAHWLRHTHASHALAAGAALIHVKENLGHASLSTTSAYLHADKDERHAAMGGLFQK